MGATEEVGKDQRQWPTGMEAGCRFMIAETEHLQSSDSMIAETGRMPTQPPRLDLPSSGTFQ